MFIQDKVNVIKTKDKIYVNDYYDAYVTSSDYTYDYYNNEESIDVGIFHGIKIC